MRPIGVPIILLEQTGCRSYIQDLHLQSASERNFIFTEWIIKVCIPVQKEKENQALFTDDGGHHHKTSQQDNSAPLS